MAVPPEEPWTSAAVPLPCKMRDALPCVLVIVSMVRMGGRLGASVSWEFASKNYYRGDFVLREDATKTKQLVCACW